MNHRPVQSRFRFSVAAVGLLFLAALRLPAAESEADNTESPGTALPAQPVLRHIHESRDPSRAVLRVYTRDRSPYPIPVAITGKFAEHLGANIYNGMDAQILRNPTLAEFLFWNGQMDPDGITKFYADEGRIDQEIRRQAARYGWPSDAVDGLIASRAKSLACWWTREGKGVEVSPDTGPHGGRAQRLRTQSAGQGLAQWTYLPLHRIRQYQFDLLVRSPELTSLSISLWAAGAEQPAASATVSGVSSSWQTLRGTLAVDEQWPADAPYRLAVTTTAPGQFVIGRIRLWPADHAHGADPDVVRLLKESRLPLLRWPGGNFVSGYHWEDGVGPIEQRPTRPNYAWGGVEPNLFGTDEFIQFCRDVGCEPMICLNAGSGTPAEAARWVEYCNGPVSSPMGARRAANGHAQPYHVVRWEVGNELWGHWQYRWTTAEGYVDRYRQFARAMRAADPTIRLYACGAPVLWGKHWNDTLIAGTASLLQATTDHPLIGGTVARATEPLDVYRDFMAVPEVLEKRWAALGAQMAQAGISRPHLAVTELQMFAHLGPAPENGSAARLRPDNLVNPGTLAEALYDVLIYHAAVRLGPFVELVTHSAVINHGGGLRKEHERVYANPCYYGQAAFAALAGATPVRVELECSLERPALVLGDIKQAAAGTTFGAVDALAAVAADGSLWLSLVHRGSAGPVHLSIHLQDFAWDGSVIIRTLSAAVPWASNTLDSPTQVKPRVVSSPPAAWDGGPFELLLEPYSLQILHLNTRR